MTTIRPGSTPAPRDPGCEARQALSDCSQAVAPALDAVHATSVAALDAAERIVRARARRTPSVPADVTGAFAPYRAAVGAGGGGGARR